MAAEKWYVVQVSTGREKAVVDLMSRRIPKSVLTEAFWPQYQTQEKRDGQWVMRTKALLPGYLIAVTPDVDALGVLVKRAPEFARLLTMGEGFVPLLPGEKDLIGRFTEPGRRVVPMSYAVKEGDAVRVVKGPLMGYEGLISEVNRHKSTAYVRMHVGDRTVGVRMGLGVLSVAKGEGGPSAEEIRAAL